MPRARCGAAPAPSPAPLPGWLPGVLQTGPGELWSPTGVEMPLPEVRVAAPARPQRAQGWLQPAGDASLAQVSTGVQGGSLAGLGMALGGMREGTAGVASLSQHQPRLSEVKLQYLVSETAEALRQGTGIYILKLATYKTTKAAEANQHVDICLIEK